MSQKNGWAMLPRAAASERRDRLAQWYTPADIADRMASWVGWERTILEPSAGHGAIIRAVLYHRGYDVPLITAVDLDPANAAVLREISAVVDEPGSVLVDCCDYLRRPPPPERFGLAIMNPPYTAGVEADHIAKAMDESERVIALLPTRSLHGRKRYDAIWSRLDRGEWHLRREARLVKRPRFGGDYSGTDEIIVIDLRREPGPCVVEWWR